MHTYTVQRGDNLSKIAQREGLTSWRTIYYDPANAGFRRLRPDPNLIYPGDVLNIPEAAPAPGGGRTHPGLLPGAPLPAGRTITDDKCCFLATNKECPYPGGNGTEGEAAKANYTCPSGHTKQHWVCTEGTRKIGCGECVKSPSTTCWQGPFVCSIWWYL